jgi:hypothetical protein
LIAMSTCDVRAGFPERPPPYGVRHDLVDLRPSATHSGQWNPTAAWCMQSGQIGRPHLWQWM